jgi:hypothetical protein
MSIIFDDDFICRAGYLPALYRQLTPNEKNELHKVILGKISKLNVNSGLCEDVQKSELSFNSGLCEDVQKGIFQISKYIEHNLDVFPFTGVNINGMHVSPIPTCRHNLPKLFTLGFGMEYNSNVERVLESVVVGNIVYLIGFVNSEEFSANNLENVLLMDYNIRKLCDLSKIKIFIPDKCPTKHNYLDIYQGEMDGCDVLNILDKEDFYSPSKVTGKNLTFCSHLLAKHLTKLVKDMNLTIHEISDLVCVNPIFKLCKFTTSDCFPKQTSTPYYNKTHKQMSLYTLVIYLTEGKAYYNKPILNISDDDGKYFNLYKVDIGTFVIFNQDYEYCMNQLAGKDKLFLVTDLIFDYTNMSPHDHKNLPKVLSSFRYTLCPTMKNSLWVKEYEEYSKKYIYLSNCARFYLNRYDKYISYPVKKMEFTYESGKKITEIYYSNGTDYYFHSPSPIEHGSDEIIYFVVILLLDLFSRMNFSKKEIIINTIQLLKGIKSLKSLCDEIDILTKKHQVKRDNDFINLNKITSDKFSAVAIAQKGIKVNVDDINIGLDTIVFKNTGIGSDNIPSYKYYTVITDTDMNIDNSEHVGFNLPPIKYNIVNTYVHMTCDIASNHYYKKSTIVVTDDKNDNNNDNDCNNDGDGDSDNDCNNDGDSDNYGDGDGDNDCDNDGYCKDDSDYEELKLNDHLQRLCESTDSEDEK